MSDFPWTEEEINEKIFQEQYQNNVNECAEEIIKSVKLHNDGYIMNYFTDAVFKKVKKELSKMGEWE